MSIDRKIILCLCSVISSNIILCIFKREPINTDLSKLIKLNK